jgi:hypothetical protein
MRGKQNAAADKNEKYTKIFCGLQIDFKKDIPEESQAQL